MEHHPPLEESCLLQDLEEDWELLLVEEESAINEVHQEIQAPG